MNKYLSRKLYPFFLLILSSLLLLFVLLIGRESERFSIVEEPAFSVDSGFYNNSFFLTIKGEGDIFYTTDGEVPTKLSKLYDGPIHVTTRDNESNLYSDIRGISISEVYYPDYSVDKATIIKAICVDKHGNSSDIAERIFFVGFQNKHAYDHIPIVSISVDPDDFFSDKRGIYVLGDTYNFLTNNGKNPVTADYNAVQANYAQTGRKWEREAVFSYFDENHQKKMVQKVGIRIHGNWSTAYNQKSFNIYARKEYDGNPYFNFHFFGDNQFDSQMMLRAGGFRDLYAVSNQLI